MRLIEIPDDGIVRIPIVDGESTVGERRIDLSDFPTALPEPGWISVKDRLPENAKPVWVFGHAVNNSKRTSTFKGRWIAEHTMLAADFGADDDMALIYDESEDEYYVPEGWFERIENWDDYTDIAVGDYIITHWMPLPELPEQP